MSIPLIKGKGGTCLCLGSMGSKGITTTVACAVLEMPTNLLAKLLISQKVFLIFV